MNIFIEIQNDFLDFLKKNYQINKNLLNINFDNNLEEKRIDFGDFSTNAPFVISKILKINHFEIINNVILNFKNINISKIEAASNGFLNFFIKSDFYENYLSLILKNKILYEKTKNKKKYNIEFVSANPTGPLHIGHGRGGIIGDILANVLKELGHEVTKEFYINDAGSQIEKLGKSLKARYQELCGLNIEFLDDWYSGDYLINIANDLFKKNENSLLNEEINFFSEYGKKKLLEKLKETLNNYGINFDIWFSEKILHLDGSIEKALKILSEKNFCYELDNSLWFKSTNWNDDKDRVLKKSNGEYTYISADIAYLKNKIDRGYDHLIMILGQDHHSYKTRLNSIINALGYKSEILSVILYQLVTIKKNDESVRLSKRAGNIVLLDDIIKLVGKDIARFFYLNKDADAHLNFDIKNALENSTNNPVYYINYAIVRMKSILKKFEEIKFNENHNNNNKYEYSDIEKMILRKINSFGSILNKIENSYETHILTYYLLELTSLFHNFYTDNQCLNINNKDLTEKRINLVKLNLIIMEKAMNILGIKPSEIM